jgi:hypothetical protein
MTVRDDRKSATCDTFSKQPRADRTRELADSGLAGRHHAFVRPVSHNCRRSVRRPVARGRCTT